MSLVKLKENWNQYGLSWSQQEVIGCLLPNNVKDT